MATKTRKEKEEKERKRLVNSECHKICPPLMNIFSEILPIFRLNEDSLHAVILMQVAEAIAYFFLILATSLHRTQCRYIKGDSLVCSFIN